jgi:hypothetical protein
VAVCTYIRNHGISGTVNRMNMRSFLISSRCDAIEETLKKMPLQSINNFDPHSGKSYQPRVFRNYSMSMSRSSHSAGKTLLLAEHNFGRFFNGLRDPIVVLNVQKASEQETTFVDQGHTWSLNASVEKLYNSSNLLFCNNSDTIKF